ncbi:hypothetical protein V8D89_000437 [Ganoderma adspersum]
MSHHGQCLPALTMTVVGAINELFGNEVWNRISINLLAIPPPRTLHPDVTVKNLSQRTTSYAPVNGASYTAVKSDTTCGITVMTPRREIVQLHLAHRAPDAPLTFASVTVEDYYGPVVINVPSFTECIPTNITWTGGVAPYSVFINVRDSSENLRQFVSINTPHFVWSPDVPAKTLVSLQVIDQLNVLTSIEDPILVEEKPLSVPCGPPSTASSSVPTTTQSQTPSPLPPTDMPQAVSRKNHISGSAVAATVVGAVIFLTLLATLSCWCSRVRSRRREKENGNDSQEKAVVQVESIGGLGESRSGAGSTNEQSIVNPFVKSENFSYAEISMASPMAQSPFIGSESLSISSPSPTNTVVRAQALSPTLKAVPQARQPPSVSIRYEPDSDPQTPSETDTAGLSIWTSSTLPPSYRTHRSAHAGSIVYIPIHLPSHPSFLGPPPPYASQSELPPSVPPSASRTPVPAPAPRKRLALNSLATMSSLERGSFGEPESATVHRESVDGSPPRAEETGVASA